MLGEDARLDRCESFKFGVKLFKDFGLGVLGKAVRCKDTLKDFGGGKVGRGCVSLIRFG